MCPDPLEQRGLALRLAPEHRRIAAQHRRLAALQGRLAAALAAGAGADASAALRELREAFDAHTRLEEEYYFPALRGLRPAFGPRLDRLAEEHRALRAVLARVGELLGNGGGGASAAAFDAFASAVELHEATEEALAREVLVPAPTRRGGPHARS
jgi:hypothetical protein